MIKKLIFLIMLSSFAYSQETDSTIALQKKEYIGVIKGIKYLEAKDSLVMDLISNYDTQIFNYKKLRDNDSLKFYYTEGLLNTAVEERNKLEKDLYDCENPPFYNTRIAFAIYGIILVVLIGISI